MAHENSATAGVAAGAGSSPLAVIKILVLAGVVIGAECIVAYMFLPSPADTAVMAAATLPAAKPANGHQNGQKTSNAEKNAEKDVAPVEEIDPEKPENVEVDLGQFTVTSFQPSSASTLRIDFHLYGVVSAKHEKEFLRLKEENKHRFRDQVLVTVRSAELSDLTDASLGLLKRRILEKTNRLLGKPLLQGVIFTDFSFIEQ
jgi:flagellar basal body-associated protein FliL